MNIIIVDDEMLICDTLDKYIRNYYEINKKEHNVNIFKFENEFKLFDYIESGNKADLIFMDIRLKRHNGIDIAAKLQKTDNSLKLVFITGFIKYAKDIFNANPVHFLVKPISQKDINNVLDRIELDYLEYERDVISFKIDQIVHCVNKKDIYYIEAEGRNINIHLKEKKYRINGRLSDLYEKVSDVMAMCHRSYIVNVNKIETINKYEVVLISGKSIPLSRRRREELERRVLL